MKRPRAATLEPWQIERMRGLYGTLVSFRYGKDSAGRDAARRELVAYLLGLWDDGVPFTDMAAALGVTKQSIGQMIRTDERVQGC